MHDRIKRFSCEQCDYSAARKSHIRKHVLAVHERKKPFSCDLCGYSTAWKPHIRDHMWKIHKIQYVSIFL